MRSRYSAYAVGEVSYVLQTTHPSAAPADRSQWRVDVRRFCDNTRFIGVQIVETGESDGVAWVTFRAELLSGGKTHTMEERSRFEHTKGRWLYLGAWGAPCPRAKDQPSRLVS